MVKVAPVNMGVPPVGVVYQLNVAPGVVDDAVKIVVCPVFTALVGGITVTAGAGLTFIAPVARVVEVIPVAGSLASA